MKYIFIDDEHALYKRMFSDCFKEGPYDIEEIPRMVVPSGLKWLYKLHINDKINRRIWLPAKMLWKPCYRLHKYNFDENEEYRVLFMNGSLKYHFDEKYLLDFKKNHPNVKLVMIMYDSFSNKSAKRSIGMIPIFDYVFSFDQGDCERHGFMHIYSTFSRPDFVYEDETKKSKCFFIGYGVGRLEILQNTFAKITAGVKGCKFYIAGVKSEEQKSIPDVIYNHRMSYDEELQMAYNTDCVVEVVKEGQTGVSLRTCEAIAFNKKLITNNQSLLSMPFYDERYMQVFKNPEEIDLDFINKDIVVKYEDSDYFSPLKIIEQLKAVN
ncbi:hypothetical protein SAMN04487831_11523 [Pseudobutyrivibrio sp. UC1225]|uniref:hypothetical protein n=1 Tax=Pseudobutyrivibrio sp. UC1225 TaxID=1798185 RepID=UPI0008F3D47F|nr:hypothetical protein [Pseudobutyrivibrio sp. UC1225]SFO26906.1 hypothetical protein SAMN04487831_11523 [Pseudobutyrivibrio sp. UC1225]